MCRTVVALLIGIAFILPASAQQQAGWRADGRRYPSATAPTEWSRKKNVSWSTKMPGWGNASPILVGGSLFATAEPDILICVDAQSSKISWQQRNGPDQLQPKQEDKPIRTHKQNGYASATPVSDGKNVFFLGGKGIVASYDLKGKRNWIRAVNQPTHRWGHSASPLIVEGKLVVHVGNKVTALNLADGKTAWTANSGGAWGSPIAFDVGGTKLVATTGGVLLRAKDGRVIAQDMFKLPWSSPVFVDGTLYYVDERGAGAISFPAKLTADFKPTPSWTSKVHRDRYYSTPVVHNGLLYNVTRNGMLTALNAKDGAELYKRQLKIGRGWFYSSITLIGKELLVSTEGGTTLVFEAGRSFKEVRRIPFEGYRTCPLVVGSRIYLRTKSSLYCIGK